MPENDIALIAHLMRRAGFGATRSELEEYASRGYDAVFDELLNPRRLPDVEEDTLRRDYLHFTHMEQQALEGPLGVPHDRRQARLGLLVPIERGSIEAVRPTTLMDEDHIVNEISGG